MPPPPRVLEEFYKTKTVEQIEQSKGHKRSGYARVQLDGGSRWTQQWVVLDVGGDCAVVCLARDAGPVKPAEVLSSAHYSAEPLDPEEAQGPSDFCFQLTDFSSSPPRHHLFSVDSAEDRDGWLDAFDDNGVPDNETGTGFSVTDMTDATDATDQQSVLSFASSILQPPDEPHPSEDVGSFMNSPFSTPQSSRPQEGAPASGNGGPNRMAVTVTKADGPTVGLHLTMKSGDNGVYYVVDHVAPGSVAKAKGLRVGDRVLSVQGQDAKHISGDQVTLYMQQRPLHMVILTEDARPSSVEFQLPSSPPARPSADLSARPALDLSQMQSSVGDPETRRQLDEAEWERLLQLERSARQSMQAQLSEERTARQAMETQLRELMSQAQSLQSVNGELRRALEALEATHRHQANAAASRTLQTAVSAPRVDQPASSAAAPAAKPVPSRADSTASAMSATSSRAPRAATVKAGPGGALSAVPAFPTEAPPRRTQSLSTPVEMRQLASPAAGVGAVMHLHPQQPQQPQQPHSWQLPLQQHPAAMHAQQQTVLHQHQRQHGAGTVAIAGSSRQVQIGPTHIQHLTQQMGALGLRQQHMVPPTQIHSHPQGMQMQFPTANAYGLQPTHSAPGYLR